MMPLMSFLSIRGNCHKLQRQYQQLRLAVDNRSFLLYIRTNTHSFAFFFQLHHTGEEKAQPEVFSLLFALSGTFLLGTHR